MIHQEKVTAIVEQLNMLPHPEGGYFKETYRSKGVIPQEALPEDYSGGRNYSTAIYFLLTSDNFAAFHRIKQDEIWHYYSGSSLYVHVISSEGEYTRHVVGMNLEKGELPQLVVPAGAWFASSVKNDNDYSFVGCTVAPGFDFDDFELAKRSELIQEFPMHAEVIEKWTR